MEDESKKGITPTLPIKVRLDDGTTFFVRAQPLRGESNVSIQSASFTKVVQAIQGVGKQLSEVWKHIEPSKASVEMSVEFTWDTGELLAMIVDSSNTASMKITLEWEHSKDAPTGKSTP